MQGIKPGTERGRFSFQRAPCSTTFLRQFTHYIPPLSQLLSCVVNRSSLSNLSQRRIIFFPSFVPFSDSCHFCFASIMFDHKRAHLSSSRGREKHRNEFVRIEFATPVYTNSLLSFPSHIIISDKFRNELHQLRFHEFPG